MLQTFYSTVKCPLGHFKLVYNMSCSGDGPEYAEATQYRCSHDFKVQNQLMQFLYVLSWLLMKATRTDWPVADAKCSLLTMLSFMDLCLIKYYLNTRTVNLFISLYTKQQTYITEKLNFMECPLSLLGRA